MAGVDQLNQVFFDGVAEGQLRIQQCGDCGAYQFYPRVVCKLCGSEHVHWTVASGRGQVASFSVVRRGVSADFAAPYIVALIELEEGVTMMSHVVDVDPNQVISGMAVTLTFRTVGGADIRPVFIPASKS
jgi:uncharacterized OB-fold protein